MINKECSICGNSSGYDKRSLRGSSCIVNGVKLILCCPCEDELKRKLNKSQIKKLKIFYENNKNHLMSEELIDLNDIMSELRGIY